MTARSPKILMCLIFVLISMETNSQTPAKVKAQSQEYREYMVTISRQLGVTCAACHDTGNFTSDIKIPFKLAKDHMRLVQVLIDGGMDGQKGHPKADCYLCHRGKLHPDYKEPIDPLTLKNKKLKPDAPTEENDPE